MMTPGLILYIGGFKAGNYLIPTRGIPVTSIELMDEPNDPPYVGYMKVYFDNSKLSEEDQGGEYIYRDDRFVQGLRNYLIENTSLKAFQVGTIEFTESGLQGRDYAHLEYDQEYFPELWEALESD